MDFYIMHASGLYTSGYDYPGDYQEYADKIAHWGGLPTTVEIADVHHPEMDEPVRSYAVKVRIETVEKLVSFQRRFGKALIIEGKYITIYDDHIE